MKSQMKSQILTISVAVILSTGVSAHQIKNEAGHNAGWDWNMPNHTHDKKVVKAVKAVRVTPKNTVKGIKGLDGIAKVGECYVTAYVEASCKNEAKEVLVKAAYNDIQLVPAVTKEVERRVLIESEKTIEEYIPALYENVSRRILVEEAHTEWKKGTFNAVQKTVNGDTYCLVQVPARYKTTVEKVLKIPASSKIRTVDAVYKTYKETVVVTPETTRIVKRHPAVYKMVQECVEKTAGHYQWRSILCEQNATPTVLKSFEKALSSKGNLASSEVDGVINDKTNKAIKSYQRAKGLAVDGLVNIDTVKSLGVKY